MSAKVVEQFKKELLDECGLAPKTVKDILVVLHSILKYIAKQYPGILPVVEIIYPKEQKKEMRVLTVEEQKRLISYLMTDMDECRFGILLALLTGIRIGELCALRWEDVSLEDRTIRIASTMQRLKNDEQDSVSKTKILIGAPKSGSSLRTTRSMNMSFPSATRSAPVAGYISSYRNQTVHGAARSAVPSGEIYCRVQA